MTKKFHILLAVLALGFFSTPKLAYSCETNSSKTEKSCCKKNKTDDTDKKVCCTHHHFKNNQNEDDCKGKCKKPSCTCTTSHCVFTTPLLFTLKSKSGFIVSKKNNLYDKNIHLSDGFHSVWTPPNIG